MTRPAWYEFAVCRGSSDLFYDHDGEPWKVARAREHKAKAICSQCPVREACYDYAMANREWGVWGGTTRSERMDTLYPERARRRKLAKRKAG